LCGIVRLFKIALTIGEQLIETAFGFVIGHA
jgi:hypothetical protein